MYIADMTDMYDDVTSHHQQRYITVNHVTGGT